MRLRVTLEDKSLNFRIVYLFFKCKLSYVLHSRVGKNSKKRATATQGVTCFVKRVKSSYRIFHDTLKCHYHDSFTCSLLVNFFYSVSQSFHFHCSFRCICVCEPSVSIRFSPSFYQLKQFNVDKKVDISAVGFIEVHADFTQTYGCY